MRKTSSVLTLLDQTKNHIFINNIYCVGIQTTTFPEPGVIQRIQMLGGSIVAFQNAVSCLKIALWNIFLQNLFEANYKKL